MKKHYLKILNTVHSVSFEIKQINWGWCCLFTIFVISVNWLRIANRPLSSQFSCFITDYFEWAFTMCDFHKILGSTNYILSELCKQQNISTRNLVSYNCNSFNCCERCNTIKYQF